MQIAAARTEECRRQVEKAASELDREAWLRLAADDWLKLAEDAERRRTRF
jgi:hypothetical protein